MKSKRMIALMWALALLPAGMVAVCWPFLPERIPTNWGFDGTVSYGGRGMLWTIAAVSVGVALLYQFLPRIDPKRANYERFQGVYDGFGVALPLFFSLMMAVVLTESLRPGTLNVGKVVMAAVAVFFMGVGCVLGKVKPNWFMGIRTPWALADPDVWNKTHRLGGWVFFLSGLVTLPLALLCSEKVVFIVFFGILMGGLALTGFMSWKWYRDKQKEEQ